MEWMRRDRKSTRLNSSHLGISYAVFCLKKKKGQGDGVRDSPCLCRRAGVVPPRLWCGQQSHRQLQQFFFFFFNDPAPPEIYPLPLPAVLPISTCQEPGSAGYSMKSARTMGKPRSLESDRKSTRLNSSHLGISYAVFCLKK